MRILLVEDDPMIGKTLQQALQQDGYAVDWAPDGEAARTALATGRDAYALVLVVTARDAIADRVAGLDAGADDYLTKPFSLDELAARMRALLQRDIAREG